MRTSCRHCLAKESVLPPSLEINRLPLLLRYVFSTACFFFPLISGSTCELFYPFSILSGLLIDSNLILLLSSTGDPAKYLKVSGLMKKGCDWLKICKPFRERMHGGSIIRANLFIWYKDFYVTFWC